MNHSKVYELVWSYFDEDDDVQGFTKSAKELNQEIKERFGYDPQLHIEEAGSSYDTSYDQYFHVIAFIDEHGKLRLDTWTEENGDVPKRFF